MTDDMEKIETCRTAMKAAMEAIQDYCGEAVSVSQNEIRLAAVNYSIPDDIVDIGTDDGLTESERVLKISQSDWAQEIAMKVCSDMFTAETSINTCVGGLIQRIGELTIAKLAPEGIYAHAEEENL